MLVNVHYESVCKQKSQAGGNFDRSIIEHGLICFRPTVPFFERPKVTVGQAWASAWNEIARLDDGVVQESLKVLSTEIGKIYDRGELEDLGT
jgi:hypothetical protein